MNRSREQNSDGHGDKERERDGQRERAVERASGYPLSLDLSLLGNSTEVEAAAAQRHRQWRKQKRDGKRESVFSTTRTANALASRAARAVREDERQNCPRMQARMYAARYHNVRLND